MTEQELANVIWDIKEIIRNVYDDAEVEDVILPFTLLRRLDCVLDDHRDEIMKALEGKPENQKKLLLRGLMQRHGLSFFNSSGLSLEKLLGAPKEIATAFSTYLDGFTDNVKDILANFVHTDTKGEVDLSDIYTRLERYNKLFSVIQLFVQRADLHPDKVSNAMMGTIFEIVIRRAKESSNAKAGQFYTPREIVRLLVSLTISGRERELFKAGRAVSIYDPCCGTGGMLTGGRQYILDLTHRQDMKIFLYGQELNEKTYAICKSDLLMKGDDKDLDQQVFQGDTLADDKLKGKTFDFMLANPPFGVDWGKDDNVKGKVLKENCIGGRFEAGLPSTSDGSLLFLQHMISKMDPNGSRIGIVLNGSPLFNGDAGSGWSNIRKMLLDRNLLDAIVALPANLFYSATINTYLWILDNNRPAERRDKVLFIDANHKEYISLLQKNLGKKRFEINEPGALDILEIYKAYEPCSRQIVNEKTGETETIEVAKLMDYDDFLFTNVAIRRPLRLSYDYSKAQESLAEASLKKSDREKLEEVLAAWEKHIDGQTVDDYQLFTMLRDHKVKVTAAQTKLIRTYLGKTDETAREVHEKAHDLSSPVVADPSLNDTEKIPMKRDIDEYFASEVLPFVPDAWMDRDKDKVGCEFPFTKLFYRYRPLRSQEEILNDILALDKEMDAQLRNLKND